MKVIKFRPELVPLVLSGEKTATWRLFDDKGLSVDDAIELRVFGSLDLFGTAHITKVVEKKFRDLTLADKQGHGTFANNEAMYPTFTEMYGRFVGPNTIVKIIWFSLRAL